MSPSYSNYGGGRTSKSKEDMYASPRACPISAQLAVSRIAGSPAEFDRFHPLNSQMYRPGLT